MNSKLKTKNSKLVSALLGWFATNAQRFAVAAHARPRKQPVQRELRLLKFRTRQYESPAA
jgi:hypothetical protein